MKSFFYSIVVKRTGQVFRGWRYAEDRKSVKKILVADYGPARSIQFLRLEQR